MLGQPIVLRASRAPRSWDVFAGLRDDQDVDEGVLAAAALYLVLAAIEDNPEALPEEARAESGRLATLAGHCRSLDDDMFFSREVFDQEVVRRLCGLGVSEALGRAIAEDVSTSSLAEASRLFDLEPGSLAQGTDLFGQARLRADAWARARAQLFTTHLSDGMAELVAGSVPQDAWDNHGEKNAPLRACLVAHPFPSLAAALCKRGAVELCCPQRSAAQALSSLVDWCFDPAHPAVRLRLPLEDEVADERYDLVLGEHRAYENAVEALTDQKMASATAGSEELLGLCAERMAPGGSAVVLASSRCAQSGDADVRRGLLEAGLVDAVIELREAEGRTMQLDASLWVLRQGRSGNDDVLLGQAAGDGLAALERDCGGSLYRELRDSEKNDAAVRALAASIAAREPLPLLSARVSVDDILATSAADVRYTTYAQNVDLERRVEELADGLDSLRADLKRRYRELEATLSDLW